ncbi:hypothetical protein M9H77_35002 [Catharanthus roseus]|uniref:Uncharacterized protein n=1 Tax=Catharanthus roseus TaxID=4058 RepID=A0ACB9ZMT0_CATRO|nr:hypothetical protein M9H77_35002 [Catharanthus roseus]
MYLIPLGLIVMNAITQAMNMPEEQQGGGQQGAQQPISGVPRGQGAAANPIVGRLNGLLGGDGLLDYCLSRHWMPKERWRATVNHPSSSPRN